MRRHLFNQCYGLYFSHHTFSTLQVTNSQRTSLCSLSSIFMFSPDLEPSMVENERTLKTLNDKFSQCCNISVCVGYCDCKITNEEDLAMLSLIILTQKVDLTNLFCCLPFRDMHITLLSLYWSCLEIGYCDLFTFAQKITSIELCRGQGSKGKSKIVSVSEVSLWWKYIDTSTVCY